MSHLEVYASALNSDRFEMVALGSIVVERTERASLLELPALSVGKLGVTAQLEGVAKQNSEVLRKVVRKGDLVINARAERKGAAGLSLYEGSVSPVYSVMVPKPELLAAEFGHYLLRSVAFQEEFFRWGTGIVNDLWSTNFTRMARIRVPLPPLRTQKSIASYLDREIGEIDAMRAKLNELESTLLKRRRAVILEATCQGGPEEGKSATPSSFEVSKHEWQIVPLKFAVDSAQTGVWGQEANGGSDDLPCVRVADFDRLRNRVTEAPTIRRIEYKDRVRCELQKGDLLVEKSGGTGKNPVGAVVAFIGDFPAVCSNFIIRLRCRENQYPRFWLYALHGSYIAGRTWNYVRQTTGIQNLDVNGFMSMSHPAPDFDEQRRIAEHLDEVTSRIDAMLAKIDELKALLVERRAALITDVVTGRKKVPA